MTRPLLVIDGDNFAHRSYHALPKSIRRKGNRGGGAIIGFSNFLLNLYAGERPRAVLVGWDTLGAPTYRQELFPAYQGGRQFDEELVEQLDILPELVAACGFANAKAAGYEADDFLAAAAAAEEGRGGHALVASGDIIASQMPTACPIASHGARGATWSASMRCSSSGVKMADFINFGPSNARNYVRNTPVTVQG